MTLFRNRYRVESTRLADWDYCSRGWYFVTLCTKDKKCSLGSAIYGEIILSDAGVIADTEMKAVSSHYLNVIIDRFVVMTNHVHAIVVIEGDHTYSRDSLKDGERSDTRPGDAASRVSTGESRQRCKIAVYFCYRESFLCLRKTNL
jgi:REP-associated tyrosine transposase